MLKYASVDGESCKAFSMKELEKALGKMRRKGAPGGDDITPAFLKELGPKAKEELLNIFNESFMLAVCPQAIIIPLLKAGKPSGEVKSYRPVSLTSCVVKLFERMLAERIYHILESSCLLNKSQAGFRKGRSCEDQILKITQAIENGFQRKQMERSVLVLLDYSSAFDTVWRQRLLLSMFDKGIPLQIIRWLASFLDNRQAKVRFGDGMSKSRIMRQGLPQGSVLSPLLFIIFIDNLASILPDTETNTLFADDVALLVTRRSKEEAAAKAQELVNTVVHWSKEWKLTLNASKSETAFFTTWTQGQADFKPEIVIDGKKIPFKKNPRLLGVYLDCQLSFQFQAKSAAKGAEKKLKLLAAVAHSDWGWRRPELKKLYSAFIRGRLDYAPAAWQPWLTDSNIGLLDRVQNKAARLITGQMASTPTDALKLETGFSDYTTIIRRMCLRSAEKAARMPSDHPLKETLLNAVPPKNDSPSWKKMVDSESKLLPRDASSRSPVSLFVRAPWRDTPDIEVYPQLSGVSGRSDPLESKRAATITRLDALNSDLTLYTDGSASAGTRDGGSAVVITRGVAENPTELDRILRKGAGLTSSYEEELQAAKDAVHWISNNQDLDPEHRITIATDSQSLCNALLGSSHEIGNLLNELETLPCKTIWQWVPGHSDAPGNEMADAGAKEATKLQGAGRPISLNGIKAEIKNIIPCKALTHTRSLQVYSKLSKRREEEITSRKDQVYLARLRSGHHLGLMKTQHRYNKDIDPMCRRCEEDIDDLEHWLRCDGTAAARMEIFGYVGVELSALTESPQKILALARRTLSERRRGAGQLHQAHL